MESIKDWARRADGWLEQDHALLTDASGFRVRLQRPDMQVWSRPMPDDPNELFRWRVPAIAAPAKVVFEGFVHRLLDYHKHWTKEFVEGHVVATLAPNARVLYQRFDPGIPGISRRDLCSIEVVHELSPGVYIVSYRSVDSVSPVAGHKRIDWWGAALCSSHEDGSSSELVYLDRENQGGLFPAWLMNRMMTKYLVLQAQQVRRFFHDGGPVELRVACPETVALSHAEAVP